MKERDGANVAQHFVDGDQDSLDGIDSLQLAKEINV